MIPSNARTVQYVNAVNSYDIYVMLSHDPCAHCLCRVNQAYMVAVYLKFDLESIHNPKCGLLLSENAACSPYEA